MDDDDLPMMLGADNAAEDDDMNDLQASSAAVQQSSDDDDDSDSDSDEEESDSDSEDDEDDDDNDNETQSENTPQKITGDKQIEEDKTKIKADKKKAKKIRKQKKIKKGVADEEAQKKVPKKEENVELLGATSATQDSEDLKADKNKAKKKSKSLELKPDIPDEEVSSKSKKVDTDENSKLEDDDAPALLNSLDTSKDDTIDLKADMDQVGKKSKSAEFKPEIDENSNNNSTETHDQFEDGVLLGADDAAQDDIETITPGKAAHETEETHLEGQVDEKKSQEDTTPTKASIQTEAKQVVVPLPDMDDSERAIYDYVAECKEVFAYVDSTGKGAIPLSAMPHALHCLGLCPFTCDIDAMEEEVAGGKEVDFAFFMATAMRIRKRESVTKTPGVVVMDVWGQLDKVMGLNGKINLDDLKGILSQMGDGLDKSELASSFRYSRQFVDEYGMLEFASWLKSIDPSFGAS